MAGAALEVEALTAGYGPTVVLEDIGFRIEAGARLAVLGRNGTGKTTLLASLMGLTRRRAGVIRLDGLDVASLRTCERALAGLGYVPQTRDVFPSLSVEENLSVALKGRPRADLEEAYALFPRLADRRRNGGRQLSGGEQQMLSIARAILGRPSVLLLDEPLEGLAPILCEELMVALQHLSQGMTMLLVEQKIDMALSFAPEALILERGRLVWSGTSEALRSQPRLVARHLGVGHPSIT